MAALVDAAGRNSTDAVPAAIASDPTANVPVDDATTENGAAAPTDRHDDKTAKSDTDSDNTAAATVSPTAVGQQVATPQPVAAALAPTATVSAPPVSDTSQNASENGELSPTGGTTPDTGQLAALGDARAGGGRGKAYRPVAPPTRTDDAAGGATEGAGAKPGARLGAKTSDAAPSTPSPALPPSEKAPLPTTGQEQQSAAADEAPARTTDASSSEAAARHARELAPGDDSGDGEAAPPSDSNPGSATDPDPPSTRDAAVTPNADATRQVLDTLVRRIGGSETAAASPAASGQADGGVQVTQAASLALAAQTASAPETHAAATATASPPAVPIAGIAVEIAAQAQAGRSRFDIRLDPPELGRIDVRLDVDRDGKVTSRVVVDRPETLDILRRDASEIERSLQQAGLKTADNNALQFSLRDNGTSGGFGNFGGHNPYPNNGSPGGSTRLIIPDRDLSPLDATAAGYGRAGGVGGIDIRV